MNCQEDAFIYGQGPVLAAAREQPLVLYICETENLVLQLGKPYVFIENTSCPRCKKLADMARESYGPTGRFQRE